MKRSASLKKHNESMFSYKEFRKTPSKNYAKFEDRRNSNQVKGKAGGPDGILMPNNLPNIRRMISIDENESGKKGFKKGWNNF